MLIRIILLLLFFSACSEKEKRSTQEWIQLFNGKDLNDWNIKITGYELNNNFGETFTVEDGLLKIKYNNYENFNEKFGHIFYKEKFSAYLIGVEYRFTGEQAEGGPDWATRNSGIMIHSQDPETMGLNQDFPISIEAQLLGGNGKDERSTLNLCTPGTHVEINGSLYEDHCLNSSSKTYHGNQWVRAEILVIEDKMIKHIVEKDTVLTYEKPQIGGGNVIHHDERVKVDGKFLKEGYISLQSESHPVEFRKVELFDLSPYVSRPEKLQEVLQDLKNR